MRSFSCRWRIFQYILDVKISISFCSLFEKIKNFINIFLFLKDFCRFDDETDLVTHVPLFDASVFLGGLSQNSFRKNAADSVTVSSH